MAPNAGLDEVALKPIRTVELSRLAARLKQSVLSPASLPQLYGISMPPCQEAVKIYLREKGRSPLVQQHHTLAPVAGTPALSVEGRKS